MTIFDSMIGLGFVSLLVLAFIHLFANKANVLGWIWHGRFLSFAAGISFAYVFIDLLPTLEKAQPILKKSFDTIIPYLDLHAYLIALLGVLFYYGIHSQTYTQKNFWLLISGYFLFNFFVGASLSDPNNPEIHPLILFTIALGMHYFIHDHNASIENFELYQNQVRWWLVGALFLGYFVAYFVHISETIETILVSFISGGVILNSLRYELPKRQQVGFIFFLLGSLIYTVILLRIGSS